VTTLQPAETISVLIVDDIPETRENLRKLLYFESDIVIVGAAENGEEAVEQAQKLQPDIVLMDINMPDMDGITASQEIGRVAPRSQIIMMSVQSETDYLRRSMMAGAKYFLTKPFTSEELSNSIHRVFEMKAAIVQAAPVAPPASQRGVPAGTQVDVRDEPSEGKLLLVYSPKGGTGCSFVAVNLAVALSQVTSQKVALVDSSLQFGDVGVLLNLQGNHTIADATSRASEIDAAFMAALLSPHPSGIRVLAAPPTPLVSETIQPPAFKKVVARLKSEYDYVVLDTWSYLDDIVLAGVDLADRIIVVMTPEIPSIKSTKLLFEITEALEIDHERVDLILNKVIPRDGIRAEQIEQNLKHNILMQFEYDPKSVRQTINQGLPSVIAQPNHPLSQGFLHLAEHEVATLEPLSMEGTVSSGAQPVDQRKSGLFGRLRK
jgi:pilus assembly protein CpaE